MKILQVISYGYLAGGAEKSVLLLKKNLQDRGHEVTVITSNHNTSSPQPRFSDIEFPEIDSPNTSLVAKMVKHFWHWPSYRVIKAAVTDFRPDIVHFHVMGQLSPSALFAIGDVPGVLTVHGPEEYVKGILEWGFPKHLFKDGQITPANLTPLGRAYYLYFSRVQRPFYIHGFRKHLAALIAPSQYMAGVLKKEQYDIPIHQIYNGIDLPNWRSLQNKHRLLYVGRLEYVKGVDVLLRAMRQVVKQLPDVHLTIVGDGSARTSLEAFVQQNQLRRHVTFCGWVNAQAINGHYAKATVVVIPSIWPENLPTVCIEALAAGRQVIGSDCGGIPELIKNGVTGRIVAPGNVDELAAAITDVLLQSDLPDRVQDCVASMQNFKVATFIQNVERLYQQIYDAV
jgi:glycosyltransferase involved in cell wall biosynthesis